MLLTSMQFEPMFIREQMNIKWHCENGISENIQKIVDEYRTQRKLTVNYRINTQIGLNFEFFSQLKSVFSVHQHQEKQQLRNN
jgi:hypothetical protein